MTMILFEIAGGGHYTTCLFDTDETQTRSLSQNKEVMQIHEDEVRTVRIKPDFDTDTVIVALKRSGKHLVYIIPLQITLLFLLFLYSLLNCLAILGLFLRIPSLK